LYAELYIGLWRALAAPWLRPWGLVPSAHFAAARRRQAPVAAPPAAPPAAPQPRSTGALIIPFDRAGRLAARL
jgi:hypothetical protein